MSDTSEEKCVEFVSGLNSAFRSRKTLSYEWRLGQLESLRKMVRENDIAIEEAVGLDLGKLSNLETSQMELRCMS